MADEWMLISHPPGDGFFTNLVKARVRGNRLHPPPLVRMDKGYQARRDLNQEFKDF